MLPGLKNCISKLQVRAGALREIQERSLNLSRREKKRETRRERESTMTHEITKFFNHTLLRARVCTKHTPETFTLIASTERSWSGKQSSTSNSILSLRSVHANSDTYTRTGMQIRQRAFKTHLLLKITLQRERFGNKMTFLNNHTPLGRLTGSSYGLNYSRTPPHDSVLFSPRKS